MALSEASLCRKLPFAAVFWCRVARFRLELRLTGLEIIKGKGLTSLCRHI